jgi:parallel beta-helix repeat protein
VFTSASAHLWQPLIHRSFPYWLQHIRSAVELCAKDCAYGLVQLSNPNISDSLPTLISHPITYHLRGGNMKHSLMLISALLAIVGSSFAQLSGIKTIGGTSPDYATIKAALQDLTAQGVTTPGVTFTIRNGVYNEDTLIVRTSTSSAGAPIVIKPEAGATVVINVAAGFSAALKIDSTKYVTIDGSNNGTTSRDMTINALGTGAQDGIWVSGQSYFTTIKNCIVRCNNLTSARGIAFIYTSATGGNPNNSVADNNLVRYTYRGIYSEGNTSTDLVNDLTISNNIVDSAAYTGIYVWYTTRPMIYSNDVNGLMGYSGTKYGIYVGSTTLNARVYRNKVHDLVQLSATGVTYGLYSSGTSTLAGHSFFNNFVWGLTPPDAGTGAMYGLYVGAGNTSIADTVAYNTVYLNGTSTGVKTTVAFYKGSATGPAYLRNNIFHNTRTDGATGLAIAFFKTTALTVVNSDNNDLYVGSPDALHVTGRIATTNYATLADWRTANSSDAASIAENPNYVAGNDLHIQTAVPTQLESGGTPVAGITTDIDGNTRNASTPDIGGDEFVGIAADMTPPQITYTPLLQTNQTTSRTLTANITDASGVPRAGIGLPVLYWKINSGTYAGATASFVNGNFYAFSFGGGVAVGDTVSYFVVAQDSASTPNVGAQPSAGAGGLTANPPAAATPPTTPSRYLIVGAPLAAGDYTVGLALFEQLRGTRITTETATRLVMREVPTGPEINMKALGTNPESASLTPFTRTETRAIEELYARLMENGKPYAGPIKIMLSEAQRSRYGLESNVLAVYPTLTAAIFDLNMRGVAGSVRFLLTDSLYSSGETFPLTVNVTADSVPAANKTVTFKPNTGVNATITGAAASSAVFKVINTNYVTIDGSNTTGGTTRNLNISNTSSTSPSVIHFGSLGTTPITGSTLKNTVIINGAKTATAVVVSDGVTLGGAGYFSNVTIQNNQVRNAYMGLYITGGTTPQNGSNVSVLSNTIGMTATDSVRYVGIYMQGVNGAAVRGNNVGGFSPLDGEVDRGVWLASGTINTVIEKNTFHDLGYVGGSGYGAKGIAVSSGLAACNNAIQNNMVYNIFGDGDSYTSYGGTYSPIGIYAWGAAQTGVGIYFNTVYLSGSALNYAATVYAIGIGIDDGCTASIQNNLVVNNLGLLASTGVGPVGIAAEISNAQFTALDYNSYYCSAASPAVNNIGKIAATDYATLGDWITASGGEAHSLNTNASFLSPANLHINPYVATPLDSAGTPVAGISDDFDGNTRNTTRPDIGADEFTLATGAPIGIMAVTRTVRVPFAGDSTIVTARIVDSTGTGILADSLLYAINGATAVAVGMQRISGTNTDGVYQGVIPGTANTDGARIEYRVWAQNTAGTTVTPLAAANSYFAGLSPLSITGVRAMNANKQLLYSGYYCRVTGTVNGPNFTVNSGRISYTFQDAFGGMNVNKPSTLVPALNVGDSIVVFGVLGQFRGTTQLTPDSVSHISIVATGRPLVPISVTVSAFNANPEAYESMLIYETNLRRLRATPLWGSNVSIPVYQNAVGDSTLLFLDGDTPVPSGTEPSYPVNVVGVAGQFTTATTVYNNGYEIIPRSMADFTNPPPSLSGNYNIGAGGQFPTLDSAFSTLRTLGVSGPVTFSLTDSTYAPLRGPGNGDVAFRLPDLSTATDPGDFVSASQPAKGSTLTGSDNPDVTSISLVGPIPGASATNRVTVRPAANVRARIVGTGSATFLLQNVSYLTFDGIATSGPTQLAIENSATNGIAIALLGNCDYTIIQNATLRAPYASGVAVYADTASGAAADSNLVAGNVIPTSQFAIYVRGGNYIARGNRILNNTIGTDSIGAVGVYNQQVAGSIIANNTISNVKDAVAAGGNVAGIWIATRQLNMQVYNNIITGVANRSTATAAVFAAGIYHFGTAADTTRSVFYNNMISGVHNPSTSATATVRGMYLSTGIQDAAYYNSVYLNGSDAAGILTGALYASSASVGLTMKNNIGINARIATGTGRAIGLYITAAPTGLTSNNNDLYVPAQTGSNVAAVGTTNYATLGAWQATGRDSQSVSLMADFVLPGLHIDSTLYTPLNNGGAPIAGITTDIDGQTRNASTPDIGADEFNGVAPPTPGWTAQTSGITNQFYSVKAVSPSVAWAAAVGGRVLRTVNGGNTWTSVGGGPIGTADIYNITAVDGNTAFVTTTPSTVTYIFRTTNGGVQWDTVFAQSGGFIDAIHMFDATNGVAIGDPVGATWVVLKTSNGGTTWSRIATEPTAVGGEAGTQNCLAVSGPSNMWIGSSAGGRIYRTTDAGATWTSGTVPGAVTGTRVISVWFQSPTHGIAGHYTTSGVYNAARTTDGGATWSAITVGTGTTYNIAVASSGTMDFWMARGTDVYRSSDRGATWTQSYTGTGTFYDVDFVTVGANTYGWGVKDNGNIVFYYGTVTGVQPQQQGIPQSFALQQNYPNPFNPTTTLRYALPKDAHISLTIYNVLGQRVATLRDDVQQVGYYDVVWSGRNDFGSQVSSGIYFYRIEARPVDGSEPFSMVKKMIMLK